MNATLSAVPCPLSPVPCPTSPAVAIDRLRVRAADVRDANGPGAPYARVLLTVLDTIDAIRLRNHARLISELWQTARAAHARMESV